MLQEWMEIAEFTHVPTSTSENVQKLLKQFPETLPFEPTLSYEKGQAKIYWEEFGLFVSFHDESSALYLTNSNNRKIKVFQISDLDLAVEEIMRVLKQESSEEKSERVQVIYCSRPQPKISTSLSK